MTTPSREEIGRIMLGGTRATPETLRVISRAMREAAAASTGDERAAFVRVTGVVEEWIDELEAEASVRRVVERGPRIFTVSSADIDRCPKRSLAPSHYRDDGTCLCR